MLSDCALATFASAYAPWQIPLMLALSKKVITVGDVASVRPVLQKIYYKHIEMVYLLHEFFRVSLNRVDVQIPLDKHYIDEVDRISEFECEIGYYISFRNACRTRGIDIQICCRVDQVPRYMTALWNQGYWTDEFLALSVLRQLHNLDLPLKSRKGRIHRR
jgi:hypothetical protein